MGKNQTTPSELHVYECWANPPPRTEPSFEGYLGLWPETPFYYLFADRQVLSLVSEWVLEQPGWSLRGRYSLDYDQWQESGKETLEIGSLRIIQGFAVNNGDNSAKSIVLRRGLVFGSGLHASPQACLLVIDRYRQQLQGAKVIDLGTGDELTPGARQILDGVAESLVAWPDVDVEVSGHTDARGADAYNLKLSDRRAKAVLDYLASKGVPASRMISKGFGEKQPIADNKTDEGRARNRRVELRKTN